MPWRNDLIDGYRYDEPQALGDVLARMGPLPAPPPSAPNEDHARTQRHNEALEKLQNSVRVAKALAGSAVEKGTPFPESLSALVPGRLVGPLATVQAARRTEQPPSGTPDSGRDPWLSYAKSAVEAHDQNPNLQRIPRQPPGVEKGPAGYFTTEPPVDLAVARENRENGLAAAEKWVLEPHKVGFTTHLRDLDWLLGIGYTEKELKDFVNRRTGKHRLVTAESKPAQDIDPGKFTKFPDEDSSWKNTPIPTNGPSPLALG